MQLSLPRENIKKPYGFLMFSGGRKCALGTNGLNSFKFQAKFIGDPLIRKI